MSVKDHSPEWYADTNCEGVTHVYLTTDNTEIGSYEPDPDDSSFLVVVRSSIKPLTLMTNAASRGLALLTILSRWDLS